MVSGFSRKKIFFLRNRWFGTSKKTYDATNGVEGGWVASRCLGWIKMGLEYRVSSHRACPSAISRASVLHKPLKSRSGARIGSFEAVCGTSMGADTLKDWYHPGGSQGWCGKAGDGRGGVSRNPILSPRGISMA